MKQWFLIFTLITLNCSAQQEPQFSQNMFNILPVNPGYAGSSDAICATLLYRNQWVGWAGTPKTMLLSVESPVKLLRGGLGLTVFSDKLGLEKTSGVKLAYAYKVDIGPGQLGIGVHAGMINKALLASEFESFIPKEQDDAIPEEIVQKGKEYCSDLSKHYEDKLKELIKEKEKKWMARGGGKDWVVYNRHVEYSGAVKKIWEGSKLDFSRYAKREVFKSKQEAIFIFKAFGGAW